DNHTPQDTKQFFEHAKAFLEQEYGKDNLLYATVHMDEKTPHMHYGVVPITDDGRLSAKEVVGNKKALTEFQDRFNEYVNQQGYKLERGQSRQVTNAKHEQMSQYKQKTEYHKQEYERESQKADHIKQQNDKLMQEYQKSLDTLKKPIYIPFDDEVKKVGGLFSKEEQKTGNVVMSEEDLKEFEAKVVAAKDILNDYEYIKSGDKLKDLELENKKNKQNCSDMYQMYQEQKNENTKLKEENTELKKDVETKQTILYQCRIAISKLLEELGRIFERREFVDRVRNLGKDNDGAMEVMRLIDKNDNPQYYQEQKREERQGDQYQEKQQEQKRNRGIQR
ncbi:TPA: MobV family relaxase, partial [Staphylococcus aureus]